MAVKDKIFYWLKLKTEFMTGEVIDFLMSQKNGANYVVLYQMLCIKTINTQGELATKIGEVLVPFDIDKIQRECKWFDRDTVIVAMELYRKLGLLYEQENGIIKITDFKELVGNETYWAKQKRLSSSKNDEDKPVGNELEIIQQPLISNTLNSKSLDSNNLKSNALNTISREEEMIDTYNFTTAIKDSILEWLKYKKEKNQKYKETGLKSLLNRVKKDFEQYGEEYVVAEFEYSMSQNYTGLYASKDNKQKSTTTTTSTSTTTEFDDYFAATMV